MSKKILLLIIMSLFLVVFVKGVSADVKPFIATWDTTQPGSANDTIVLPVTGNFSVDWGDGVVNHNVTNHTYASPGVYTIELYNYGSTFCFGNNGDKLKIINISQWGDLHICDGEGAFWGCSNMNFIGNDTLNLTGIGDLSHLFDGCSKFNGNISDWNVSGITSMSYMFNGDSSFNQPLDSWNASSVTDMKYMFYGASHFNQPLNDWDVHNVQDMSYMFHGASSFNQPLNNWNVSHVTNMRGMFYNAWRFNQNINSWDMSHVTYTDHMFYNAGNFNQPLDSWNVSHVINMNSMFWNDVFNQPLNNWNVSHVTNMRGMFYNAWRFNQNIDSWDVHNVQDMSYMFDRSGFNQPLDKWNTSNLMYTSYMFANSPFNQNINSWDMSHVTYTDHMFYNAWSFNQPLDSWDVSHVINMSYMFAYATYFNQPIDSWNVSNVRETHSMFYEAQHFNQPLNDWDVHNVRNMDFMFGGSICPFNQPLYKWNTSSVTSMCGMFYNAYDFNQYIGSWCVKNIPSRPSEFALYSPIYNTDKEPVWGTCPHASVVLLDINPKKACATNNTPLLVNATCWGNTSNYIVFVQMFNGTQAYGSVHSMSNVLRDTNMNVYNLSGSIVSQGKNWTAEVWCNNGFENSTRRKTSLAIVYHAYSKNLTDSFSINDNNNKYSSFFKNLLDSLIVNVNKSDSPPIIHLISPVNNFVSASKNVLLEWNGSDVDNNTLLYKVYMDNTSDPTTLVYSGTNTSVLLENLTDDTYYWKVIVYEGDYVITSSIQEFVVSTNSPAINLKYPLNNTWRTTLSPFNISFVATDSDGVDTCVLYDDFSGTWQKDKTEHVSSGATSVFGSFNLSNNQKYYFIIWCNDSYGNGGFMQLGNVTFGIDATPPLLTMSSPQSTTYYSQTIPLNISAFDEFLNHCSYTLYYKDSMVVKDYVGSFDCSNIIDLAVPYYSGGYYLIVKAFDDAGNEANKTVSFITMEKPQGGGGGSQTPVLQSNVSFSVFPTMIEILAGENQTFNTTFRVSNDGGSELDYKIRVFDKCHLFKGLYSNDSLISLGDYFKLEPLKSSYYTAVFSTPKGFDASNCSVTFVVANGINGKSVQVSFIHSVVLSFVRRFLYKLYYPIRFVKGAKKFEFLTKDSFIVFPSTTSFMLPFAGLLFLISVFFVSKFLLFKYVREFRSKKFKGWLDNSALGVTLVVYLLLVLNETELGFVWDSVFANYVGWAFLAGVSLVLLIVSTVKINKF